MPNTSLGLTLLFALSSLAASAAPQTPPTPRFEVAAIKPAVPLETQITTGQTGRLMQQVITDTRIDLNTLSLAELICMAYRVKAYQLTAPDWVRTERYDVQATLPPGAKKEQVPEMLQALLAERFAVKLHHDRKPQPVYALVVGKDGHKLKPASNESAATIPDDPKAQSLSVFGQDLKMSSDGRGGQVISSNGSVAMRFTQKDGAFQLEFSNATMGQFAQQVESFLGKPVIDQTELTGTYQVALELTQEDLMAMVMARAAAAGISLPAGLSGPGGQAATPSSASSIFAAVQKLGLKLDPKNLPVDMIVVDSAEKTPTDN